jgi:hypothetical protein
MGLSESTEKSKQLTLSVSFTILSFQFGHYLLGIVLFPRHQVCRGHAQGYLDEAVDEYHSNGHSEVHFPIGRISLHLTLVINVDYEWLGKTQ